MRALARLLVLGVLTVSSAGIGLSHTTNVSASTINFGSAGNCNHANPHGWSWTNWTGLAVGAHGRAYGELDYQSGSTWYVDASLYGTQFGSGSAANVAQDNYDSVQWYNAHLQEQGEHEIYDNNSGLWILGPANDTPHAIWCPW
jgi:hypothetical protein